MVAGAVGTEDCPVRMYLWISFLFSGVKTDWTSHVATTRARCFCFCGDKIGGGGERNLERGV